MMSRHSVRLYLSCVIVVLWNVAAWAAPSSLPPQYVLTNDDVAPFFSSGVSFYTVGAAGVLQFQQQVQTSGSGIGGGYFGSNRIAVLNNSTQQCVYASNATTGNIVGIDINTLQVGGTATGSPTDSGTANGIGLALNSQYLYATFSNVNTIGTFQIQPDCGLTFINDVSVGGLQGGIVTAIAMSGTILIATYGDGSVESFNISQGTPVSNGDKQNSPAYVASQGATYPNGIDITKDGHYVLFGDTSTASVVEVSDISSGRLATPVTYTLPHTINSSNILLSPDETLLYISDTQGDRISAVYFDATTGRLSGGCTSGKLRNYVSAWSYLGSLSLQSTTGTGSVIYVAEFGVPSSIAEIQVNSAGGKCTLTEMSGSPITDSFSSGLLSIGSFPPRPF
jgi:6-phosphogluconolactonase (cycloisomerase 2 family)